MDGVLKQQEFGVIKVIETEGKSAQVFLNGNLISTTKNGELLFSGIQNGEQEITLFASGHSLFDKSVVVSAGDTTEVVFTLTEAKSGNIAIVSDSGAEVIIDDLIIGSVDESGELAIKGFPIGEYLLKISSGSKSKDSTIIVKDSEELAVSIKLLLEQKVLIEHISNVSCEFCPEHAETMYHLLDSLGWKGISKVSYNANWPAKDDPLYLFEPKLQMERTMLYGAKVNYALPIFVVNGTVITFDADSEKLYNALISIIDTELAKEPLFDITLSEDKVSVSSLSDEDFDGTLYVHLVQDKVEYDESPGSNGEKVFFNAYRRSVLSEELSLKAGEKFSYSLTPDSGDLPSSGLRLTAFIQSQDNLILQTTDLIL